MRISSDVVFWCKMMVVYVGIAAVVIPLVSCLVVGLAGER